MKHFFLSMLAFVCLCMLTIGGCKDDPSCTDGKQNGGETGIDCVADPSQPCECGCPACATLAANCSDGIQNGGELGIDCGGPCPNACQTSPTCTDGIQNGTETGVDCGGSCSPCGGGGGTGTFTCKIDGTTFSATTTSGTAVAPLLTFSGTSGTNVITIVHNGAFAIGTYPVASAAPMTYANAGNNCISTSDGTLTFTQFDTTNKKISGSFSFNCTIPGGGSAITEGIFSNLSYN